MAALEWKALIRRRHPRAGGGPRYAVLAYFLAVDFLGLAEYVIAAPAPSYLNWPTNCCSSAAMRASSPEAVWVSVAPLEVFLAAVATEVMFSATWRPPCAASVTFRAISLVTAVCSSTALAIVLEISLIWVITWLIWAMACTAPLVSL